MDPNIEAAMTAQRVATMNETDRKCPQCGATMDYDPVTLGLKCPYCEHTEEIPEAEPELVACQEQDFETAEQTGNCNWGTRQKTVTCKSCGAVTVYDALDVSNECPYCGSNQVMEAYDDDTLAPGGVVIFKITKEQAGANFKNWLRRKWFCPKAAKQSASPESFKGVYVPSWTFDADTHSQYTGEYGKDRQVKKGNNESVVTDWYRTSGSYDKFIDDELVSGTTRQDSELFSSIMPYDTADNKVYRPEYLAGFAAERYTVGLKEAWEKAKEKIKNKLQSLIESKIRSDHNADHVRNLSIRTTYSNIKYKYLMIPVWISAFEYKGKVYQFMVNGQSGKVGGRSPVSALRVCLAIFIVIFIFWLIARMLQ